MEYGERLPKNRPMPLISSVLLPLIRVIDKTYLLGNTYKLWQNTDGHEKRGQKDKNGF
jgi:hypothetical protein